MGISIDPNEGSSGVISSAFQAQGFSPVLYTAEQVAAGQPIADGVTVLVITRQAALGPVSAEYVQGVHSFINGGGSIIAEYDGAALLFDAVGTPSSGGNLDNMAMQLQLFTGLAGGGGLLVPIANSVLTITDPANEIMVGVPGTYVRGNKAAYSLGGFNSQWLSVSATFTTDGANGWGAAGTYPGVVSGRCGKGRVAIFAMSLFSSGFDAPVSTMMRNSVHWVSGIPQAQ